MAQNDLVYIKENIKKLIGKSVFMPPELREKLGKKINNPSVSHEKLEEIRLLLEKVSPEEDRIVKNILKEDPLFFQKEKHRISREKLAKKLQNEQKIQISDLNEVESELENLLNT